MTAVKGRRYKESKEHREFEEEIDKEFGKFHTDRDIDEEHILIYKTERLEELEKLAMEEIMAKYENYSTMASEENLLKCRDAVEEIIAKYVNYSTMIYEERPLRKPPAHNSPVHSSPAKQPQSQFKTPALIHDDALASLGLHGTSANGNYAKNAEKTNYPNLPNPEVEHVLQPATQEGVRDHHHHGGYEIMAYKWGEEILSYRWENEIKANKRRTEILCNTRCPMTRRHWWYLRS